MAGNNEITIDGNTFALVADSDLPKGKRALQRSYIATNVGPATIPGLDRVRRVQWNVWGPIGASRESSANVLGTDFTRNLETRWPRRLISVGALVPTDADLPLHDTQYAFFTDDTNTTGLFKFNDPEAKFGGLAASGLNPLVASTPGSVHKAYIDFFDEQQGSVFAHSANIASQIDGVVSDTWNESGFHAFNADIQGAQNWYGYGRIGLGNGDLLQTRTAVLPGGSLYEPVWDATGAPVRAGAEAVGSDRLWLVDDAEADSNKVFYTLDSCENFAAPFQVGDAKVPATGIGPFGPKTFFGTQTNLYSFTDQAKPVPLSRALINHRSPSNGLQWADPGFGWNYALTNIGLRAISGTEDNPVGIGERMREFTGHNGVPTAIWAERGELWIAYLTSDGDTYIYRGVFSRIPRTADEQGLNFGQGVYGSQTAMNGHPDLYPAHYIPFNVDNPSITYAIGSTNTPPHTEMMYGTIPGIFYREIIDREGRDDLFPSRVYGILGGTWYGTLLDRDPNLLKTLRCVRIRVRNVEPCSSWQVWVSFNYDTINNVDDSNVIWQKVGPELDVDGYYTLYPVSGSEPNVTPIDNIWGRTIKLKLVQTAEGPNAATLPPEVDGQVEVEYFERPEFMEQLVCSVQATGTFPTSNKTFNVLKSLESLMTAGPVKAYIPDRLPNIPVWVTVAEVAHRTDVNQNDIELVQVTLNVYGDADGEPA